MLKGWVDGEPFVYVGSLRSSMFLIPIWLRVQITSILIESSLFCRSGVDCPQLASGWRCDLGMDVGEIPV